MDTLFRYFLTAMMVVTLSNKVFAQCNCTYSIDSTVSMLNNDTVGLKPGDTLCVTAGTRQFLTLLNFHGNADSTLVVTNCGGTVTVNSTNTIYYQQGINIKNCRFLQFTGTGHVGSTYGFQVLNTNIGSGIDVRDGSTNIELDHLEIANTHFAGIIIKDDPKCNGDYSRSNFLMRDIQVHHNYIHNTDGEGIYIGVTAYDAFAKDCSGDGIVDTFLLGHEIIGVDVHHNKLDSIGREGIQVFSALRDVDLHHNTICHYSIKKEPAHGSAIQLGNGSSGNIYNNMIKKGFGSGIHVSADSTVLIYNNIVDEAGMYCDLQNNPQLEHKAFGIHLWESRIRNTGFYFGVFNNTIIRAKNHGIKQYGGSSSNTHTAIIHNNVILKPGLQGILPSGLLAPMSFDSQNNVSESHNYFDSSMLKAGFISTAQGDFRLRNTSFLINQGKDLTAYGIDKDFADSTRPHNGAYDLGAHEHQNPTSPLDSFPGFTPDDCNFMVYPTGNTIDGSNYNYQNGSVFCLVGADWLPIRISNFHGSKDSAVTFRNYQGKLNITGNYGIQINECSHIELKGNGDANYTYGFQIRNTTGNGMDINLTTGYNIHHVLVDSAGNNAIKNQDKPCDYAGAASRSAFTQKDCQIHHSKFTNTQGSNSLAIGNPSYYYNAQGSCGLGYRNLSLSIYNNLFDNNKGTAILLSGTDSNAQVYSNTFTAQKDRCIYLDRGAFANIYGNEFGCKNGPAIRVNEAGDQYIHNNLFIATGHGWGKAIEFRPPNSSSSFTRNYRVLNNTMVLDTASEGVFFFDSGCDTGNTLVGNNIIIIPAATGTSPRPYVKLAKTHGARLESNLFLNNVDSAYFANAAGNDFNLTSASPAVDAGTAPSNSAFLIDYNLQSRPSSLFDIGAYQFSFSAGKKSASQALPQPAGNDPTSVQPTATSAYPNPAQNILHFAGMEEGDQILSFHDLSGRSYVAQSIGENSVDVSPLAEGLYTACVLKASSEMEYLSFMKR